MIFNFECDVLLSHVKMLKYLRVCTPKVMPCIVPDFIGITRMKSIISQVVTKR